MSGTLDWRENRIVVLGAALLVQEDLLSDFRAGKCNEEMNCFMSGRACRHITTHDLDKKPSSLPIQVGKAILGNIASISYSAQFQFANDSRYAFPASYPLRKPRACISACAHVCMLSRKIVNCLMPQPDQTRMPNVVLVHCL